MKRSIAVIHFNVLEKYPPAMNFILDLKIKKSNLKISVFTTRNNSSFNTLKFEEIKIWRFGLISNKKIIRYWSYLYYNILTTIILLYEKPKIIVLYETLSVFPAYVYSIIYKNIKIHIHYHEYMSLPEKLAASYYMRILFKFEKELLKIFTCSHTNEDRKALSLGDNPNLQMKNISVYPNFPPIHWWSDYGQHKLSYKDGVIRLVYVGVLDSETMYLENILIWVKENPQSLILNIFSQQFSEKTKVLIDKHVAPNIFLNTAIDYYQLPHELVKHDIGIVLYNGFIPNHVYSVPNKVYEYLYCGLFVIADSKLITTVKLGFPKILIVDFNYLDILFIKKEILKTFIQNQNFTKQLKLVDFI